MAKDFGKYVAIYKCLGHAFPAVWSSDTFCCVHFLSKLGWNTCSRWSHIERNKVKTQKGWINVFWKEKCNPLQQNPLVWKINFSAYMSIYLCSFSGLPHLFHLCLCTSLSLSCSQLTTSCWLVHMSLLTAVLFESFLWLSLLWLSDWTLCLSSPASIYSHF